MIRAISASSKIFPFNRRCTVWRSIRKRIASTHRRSRRTENPWLRCLFSRRSQNEKGEPMARLAVLLGERRLTYAPDHLHGVPVIVKLLTTIEADHIMAALANW